MIVCEAAIAASCFEVCKTSKLPGRGHVFVTFCVVQKVTQKARQRFANLWTPGTIQSSAGNNLGEVSGGTCRTLLFAQDGGEKALNRCEVRALQRKELERR